MAIYVGNNRYAPYVGGIRYKVVVEESLHYDAEIEYLQSGGNAFINTNVFPTGSGIGKIVVSFPSTFSSVGALFGVYSGDNKKNFGLLSNNNNGMYFLSGNQVRFNINPILQLETKYTFVINSNLNTLRIDDVEYQLSTTSFDGVSLYPLFLFVTNYKNENKYRYGQNIKIYSFDYDDENVSVRMIPVRIGTTGYMYDKVSKQLFSNAGTGNFILGQDINN